MAEHDEQKFEHEISEKLKTLDANIRIPEIPDAQGIFDRADEKKSNAVPFKKYSKYAAAAAAVVLICISVPVMADVLSGKIGLANENAGDGNFSVFDGDFAGDDCAESVETYSLEPEEGDAESTAEQNESATLSENEESADEKKEKGLFIALSDYFRENNSVNSAASASASDTDFVNTISDYINKKRSIEITVEKDSVSVVLFDNSAEAEIINAFWVEGTYESSYFDGGYYVISLWKKVTPEELENGNYLPMAGDAGGTYTIPAESVFISENVTMGVISLTVEIDVGTGEYRIYASLV